MSVFNSVNNSLVALMVLLLVAGSIFGISVADADIFSPTTNGAKAHQMDIMTTYQDEINRLDIQLKQAQLSAQISEIERNQQYQDGIVENKLRAQQQNTEVFSLLLLILGICLIGCIVILAVVKSIALLRVHYSSLQPGQQKGLEKEHMKDLWHSPFLRKQQLARARENERKFREAMLAHQDMSRSLSYKTMSGKQRDELPLVV